MDPDGFDQSQVWDELAQQAPSDRPRLSRRRFLFVGTRVLGALVADTSLSKNGGTGQLPGRAASSSRHDSFSEPVAEYSNQGSLGTTLRVTEADIEIREP